MKGKSILNCKICGKHLEVGEIIYRVIKQDCVHGYGSNPKINEGVAKLCQLCFDNLNILGKNNDKT